MSTTDLPHEELAYQFLSGLPANQRIALVFAVHDHADFHGREYWGNKTGIVLAMNSYPIGPFPRQDVILTEIGTYLSRAPRATAEKVFNHFACLMR